MAFLEKVLIDSIARGSKGGPEFDRVKTYVSGGRMKQIFRASQPLHQYDLSFGIKTQEDFEYVLSMFNVVMGNQYEGFRLRDWGDYKTTQANSTLEFITGSTWQLMRRYEVDGITWDRIIKKPNFTGTTIWRDRGGSITAASATIDDTTGIATISGHVGGDTYTWTGTFHVPVTFVDNTIKQIALDGNIKKILKGLPSILLEELRL